MAVSVAVIAALSREVKGLVGRLQPEPALKAHGVLLYRRPDAVVVAAGMGSARVTKALEAALATADVQHVLSIGLAGACVPELKPGSAVEPLQVIEARTGERFDLGESGAGQRGLGLVSSETIASVQEKRRLFETYGASLVDMEAATLARLTLARRLRLRAIKGISDAHDFELASLSRFSGKHGHFRTVGFALHTAVRPTTWRSAMKLGNHSNQALAAMTRYVETILSQTR